MAYKVIILYRLYMPSYFLGTFTEYPVLRGYDGLSNEGKQEKNRKKTQNYLIIFSNSKSLDNRLKQYHHSSNCSNRI